MRLLKTYATLLIVASALALASGGRADEAPLLPLQTFFANPRASWDYRVSPDGTRLAWIAMRDGRATLNFRRLEETTARVVETPREARAPWPGGQSFWWSRDGRRILFLMDKNGDENAHLFAVDVDTPELRVRDLTPQLDGVRVELARVLNNEPDVVIVRHNGRTGRAFDLYRLNLLSGEMTLFEQNSGDICGWSVSPLSRLRARFHCGSDGGWTMDVPDGVGGWRQLIRGAYGDDLLLLGYPFNPRYAWALSNRGRDRRALVRLDLRDGSEEPLYENAAVDVAGGYVHESGVLSYVWAWPGMQEWRFYDAFMQADLAPLLARSRTGLRILSEDRQRRWMTVALDSDRGDEIVYLIDRATREMKVLADPAIAAREQLAAMEPVSFPARDGLTLHGLLTVPSGATGPRPMVLLVHGGPWARDQWGFDPTVQFLANRGYAVLQLNYRGSTGYGRSHMMAGTRQFGRKMHDDLIDGVQWAIARGTADRNRVAIMGASYGGYATLSALTFTPEVFVAGVDRVGIADMVSLIEDWPQYWRVGDMGFWSQFFGDPRKPDERSYLAEKSPLNYVDAIRVPLLVVQGANDVRVRRDHSDRLVAALRERNRDVEYIVFPDEGHGINGTQNRMIYMRAVERFLARHLGGQDGGDVAEAKGEAR